MTFGNPHMLWLLLVLPPAMLVFFWWAWRQRQRLMTQFIQARLLPGLTVGISARRQKIRAAGLLAAVICLVLALARPQWGFEWEEARQRGLDIVVAIDTSKSMLAEDIAPNRLARAKLAALDLMQRARSDRLGLVAFAGSAYLQCPLTIDDGAFRQSVEALDVNVISEGGTAIGEAIETALAAFKEENNYKVLVLLTDGEDHDTESLEGAVKKATEAGMRIFPIGIGTVEGELLRIKDPKGRTDYIRDEQGNVVKSHLDETGLQKLAGATQGFYLPLRGAKTIETLYEKGLAPLPKTDSEEKLVKRYHERYHWPLAMALVLLAAEMLFPERKRESRLKGVAAQASRKPALSQAAAVVVLLLLLLPMVAHGSSASALREYKAGNYEQAQKDFEKMLERKADDPRLHFNAGAAAYRNRQFEQAAKQFDEAVVAPDLKLQELSYYNRGNTLFHLGANNPDPEKRTETWKKALQDFDSSLKLNPQDTDAKFNYDFVKKKLEELQQQQNKSDQKDQNQDQNQDQQKQDQQKQDQQKQDQKDQKQDQQPEQQKKDQQKQDQQKQDQQKKDQQKQDQQKQDQSDQKQGASQNDEKKKKDDEKKQQQQQAKKSEEQKEKQQAKKAAGKQNDKPEEGDQEANAVGQMTPEEAQQLLDAEKNQEKLLPAQPQSKGKPANPNRPIRDW